jgi:hypothetical protein
MEIGDWVKAKSKSGELLHGFLENVDVLNGKVKVYVVASDNEATVGKTVELCAAYSTTRLRIKTSDIR